MHLGGFNLMYPGFEDGALGVFKFAGFGIAAPEGGMTTAYADGGYTWWTDFLIPRDVSQQQQLPSCLEQLLSVLNSTVL